MHFRLSRLGVQIAFCIAVLVAAPTVASALPTLTVSAPDGSDGWYKSPPQVGFTSDLDFTTRYQWNGSAAGSWVPYTAQFLAPLGDNVLNYQFLDALGDPYLGTVYTSQFKVDSDMPTVTAISEVRGEPMKWHRSSTATFTWSADDPTSGLADYAVVFRGSETTTASTAITETDLNTGTWQIGIKARDRAGNWGGYRYLTHLVDLTAPSALASAYTQYEGGPATITVIAFDAESGVASYETRSGAGSWVGGASRAVTGVGTHTLYYRATDVAGNISTEKSVTFDIVANQPPVTTTLFDDESWYPGSVTVTLTANDNCSGVNKTYYELDGIQFEYVDGIDVDGEGAHSLSFWSADNVGNVETPTVLTVRIDNTDPVIDLDALPAYEGTAVVPFSASDAQAGIAGAALASSGGTVWSESPALISVLGTHIITVQATDLAGHAAEATRQVDVVANEPPSTSISGLGTGWVGPMGYFSLDATDNLSGIAATYYRYDGGMPAEYFTGVAITEEGTTGITYWSVDRAGNIESESATSYAYVDGSGPVTISDVAASYVATATITLAASDAYSGVDRIWYQLDSGDVLDYSGPFEVGTRGLSTLRFGAYDKVGNAESTNTATFVIGKWDTALAARASASKVRTGSVVTVSGKLTYPGGVVASAPVTLWSSVARGAWTKVGSASYDAGTGTYRATRRVYGNQRLQLRFAGDDVHVKSASSILSVGCLASLSTPCAPWINYRGRQITVYGTLKPKHSGERVGKLYCYRMEGDRWVLRKTQDLFGYRSSVGTKYGAVIRLSLKGRWKLVAVHQDSLHARTSSSPKILLVR